MNESALEEYVAQVMEIRFGGKVVNLVPYARLIIGGSGRVDLVGSYNQSIKIIL